jgi:hypothetical protein
MKGYYKKKKYPNPFKDFFYPKTIKGKVRCKTCGNIWEEDVITYIPATITGWLREYDYCDSCYIKGEKLT